MLSAINLLKNNRKIRQLRMDKMPLENKKSRLECIIIQAEILTNVTFVLADTVSNGGGLKPFPNFFFFICSSCKIFKKFEIEFQPFQKIATGE